jgi:hypothetical protein
MTHPALFLKQETPARDLEGNAEACAADDQARRTLYVYLCSGEVKVIPNAPSIRLEQGVLCVCGDHCLLIETFPRKDVYFCSRLPVEPPPPC